jgi:small-conductance mechanosensitive channel
LVQAIFMRIAEGRIRIHGFDREWAGPTFNILRVLIVAFLAVIAFPYFPGSASPAFQGISIFVGVLVSLGSTAAIADVTSGIVLTYTRAFHVGDRVRIADTEGDVVEKTLFVTRVRTVKNVDVTIPNALVMSNHIINFSTQARAGGLLLHTTVTIGYDVPWQTVHRALIDAALATEGIERSPEPFVLQTGLDDFYVHYELNAHTRDAKGKGQTYSALHRNMLERCHAAGIEIASPHLSAVRDGNRLQVPDDYLPKNYAPAAFRVWRLPAAKKDDG